ncbi:hypothetical protein [uncultured Chryseobacterium sp.]|uniref:hypothetical protein n=1 Tax=uncultured Chryseobacterium sp. TaxID=259322 RepID=UPI0025852AB0|nr:hypothetical protein [uncultured Chryseobacterium sp.]
MVKNKTKNRIRFGNVSNESSEALKFIYTLHEVMGSNSTYLNFYQKRNGRFYSKYIPNISFEFNNRIYDGKEGVVLLIFDEANKTTVTSRYIKKVIEYPAVDKTYMYSFSMNDLNNDLGYKNFSKDPLKQFFLKYLLVRFKFGEDELQLTFQYDEKNGKCRMSFFREKLNVRAWITFSFKEKILLKLQLRNFYITNFKKILDLKNNQYINF